MYFGGLGPSQVLRSWPEEWDIPSLLQSGPEAVFPAPGRYLHPAIEVRELAGRGRGLVVTQACQAGELVLVDKPLILAPSGKDLVEDVMMRGEEISTNADDFRRVLLGFSAGKGLEELRQKLTPSSPKIPMEMAAGIVLHNSHELEPPIQNGEVKPDTYSPFSGLWPLGSLMNHSLHPSAVRFFVGHSLCYRLTRDLQAGEELLDNYVDPRLPLEERESFFESKHCMRDEGPDEYDAPEGFFQDLERGLSSVTKLLDAHRLEDAYRRLVKVADNCRVSGHRDPAFTDILWAFADMAGELLGDLCLRLECLTAAMHYVTAREPYSIVVCHLAVAVLTTALDLQDKGEADSESEARQRFQDAYGVPLPNVAKSEAMAREHYDRIYGPHRGIFEIANPKLARRLGLTELPPSTRCYAASEASRAASKVLANAVGAEKAHRPTAVQPKVAQPKEATPKYSELGNATMPQLRAAVPPPLHKVVERAHQPSAAAAMAVSSHVVSASVTELATSACRVAPQVALYDMD